MITLSNETEGGMAGEAGSVCTIPFGYKNPWSVHYDIVKKNLVWSSCILVGDSRAQNNDLIKITVRRVSKTRNKQF